MKKNTTPIVDAIGELNFEGNIIPHSWYQHIRLPAGKRDKKQGRKCGKADHVAIILLSDIIYWYRPTIRRDELTGEVVSVEKKFYEDMLQKQYETWGELFGFTKIQTRNAVSRLIDAGLLKREFRSITSKSGIKLSNVMFVEPIIELIKRITFTHPETRTIIEQLPPYQLQSGEVGTLKSAPTLFEVDTNTETSSKISAEITEFFPIISDINNTEGPFADFSKKQKNHDIERKIKFSTFRKQLKGDKLQAFELVADNLEKVIGKTLLEFVEQSPEAVKSAYDEMIKRDKKHFSYFTKVFFSHLKQGKMSISPERQVELDELKAKLLEDFDEREQREYGRIDWR